MFLNVARISTLVALGPNKLRKSLHVGSGNPPANHIVIKKKFVELAVIKTAMVVWGDVILLGMVAVGVVLIRHTFPLRVLRFVFGTGQEAAVWSEVVTASYCSASLGPAQWSIEAT